MGDPYKKPICASWSTDSTSIDEMSHTEKEHDRPGPGAYQLNREFTKPQALSTKKTPPSYRWGTGTRKAKKPAGHDTPGPGAYDTFIPKGGNPNSRVKTAPIVKFGTSERKPMMVPVG